MIRRRGRGPVLIAGLAVLAALAGCGEREQPTPEPGRSALELFGLAARAESDESGLDRLFGPPADPLRRAALHDALKILARASEPRILSTLALEDDPRRVAVDLEAALAGAGSARFSVVLEDRAAGWRVTWFSGPGVEWPPSRLRPGPGLSSSPPPGP